MTALNLLTYLEIVGVTVTLGEDGRLRFKGPASILTDGLMAQLKRHKQELCRIVTEQPSVIDVGEALRFICRELPLSPEILVSRYFNEDDLKDLRSGLYTSDGLVALRKLIASDPIVHEK